MTESKALSGCEALRHLVLLLLRRAKEENKVRMRAASGCMDAMDAMDVMDA